MALTLAHLGHAVSGSDTRSSSVTRQLAAAGVTVHIGHAAEHVRGADVVVYSTAIPPDNVEIVEARRQGIAVRHRSGMLASICAGTEAVGVAGTHGKTTTSALLARMLGANGSPPATIIGAEINGRGIGAEAGTADLLVIEADESDGTLDVLPLDHIVLTNVDVDHLDYFGSPPEIEAAFAEAIERTTGSVVLNADDARSSGIVDRFGPDPRVRTFGRGEHASVRILSVLHTPAGMTIDIAAGGGRHTAELPLRGEHNASNFAAALAMAWALGVEPGSSCAAVVGFEGVGRRFSERGVHGGSLFVDDYAHLPAEIDATLRAARTLDSLKGRLVAVFQPNRYHRIAAMAGDYAQCFGAADVVVVTDIYASGTEKMPGVTGRLVYDAVRKGTPDAEVVWAESRDDVVSSLAGILAPGDVCVGMGCGDIETLYDDFVDGTR